MKVTKNMIDEGLRGMADIIEKGMSPLLDGSKTIEEVLLSAAPSYNEEDILKGLKLEGIECTPKFIDRKKDGTKLKIYIYIPINKVGNVPVILWNHGGGYAMGDAHFNSAMYKRLIAESNCVIVAPEYRLSTEAPYPAALEDCYEALLWLKENTKELEVRADQIMIGGESAGGGLTAALSLYARDKGEVNIAFQMPLYPMIDDRMITESAKDNNAPVWNSNLNEWAWKLYLGNLYEKDLPEYAAAARATNYKNLPPTVTFVGDLEPFRDETIEYVENLKKAGVPVNFELYKGCYHGFDIACPDAHVSKRAIKFFIESFKYAVNNYFAAQTKK